MDGRFPGKVVSFPQHSGMPLVGLAELKNVAPRAAAKLGSEAMGRISIVEELAAKVYIEKTARMQEHRFL